MRPRWINVELMNENDLTDERRKDFRLFCHYYDAYYADEFVKRETMAEAASEACKRARKHVPMSDEELKLFRILYAMRSVNGGLIC